MSPWCAKERNQAIAGVVTSGGGDDIDRILMEQKRTIFESRRILKNGEFENEFEKKTHFPTTTNTSDRLWCYCMPAGNATPAAIASLGGAIDMLHREGCADALSQRLLHLPGIMSECILRPSNSYAQINKTL